MSSETNSIDDLVIRLHTALLSSTNECIESLSNNLFNEITYKISESDEISGFNDIQKQLYEKLFFLASFFEGIDTFDQKIKLQENLHAYLEQKQNSMNFESSRFIKLLYLIAQDEKNEILSILSEDSSILPCKLDELKERINQFDEKAAYKKTKKLRKNLEQERERALRNLEEIERQLGAILKQTAIITSKYLATTINGKVEHHPLIKKFSREMLAEDGPIKVAKEAIEEASSIEAIETAKTTLATSTKQKARKIIIIISTFRTTSKYEKIDQDQRTIFTKVLNKILKFLRIKKEIKSNDAADLEWTLKATGAASNNYNPLSFFKPLKPPITSETPPAPFSVNSENRKGLSNIS